MIGVVRTILIDLCVVCSCLILSGCSWIYDNHYCCEINEEEGSFDVFSDWHECPDADPAGMAYMFFPVSGGEPWRFDFPKKDGGPLMLPDGVFHVLSFNDDTSRVLFGSEGDYSKFYCYCRETGLYNGLLTAGPGEVIGAAVTEEGEKVMEAPDEMWGECVEWFSLEASGVELRRKEDDPEISYSDRILFIYPHLLTPRYSYVVSDISNLSGVARMCASLSGMSPSLELAALIVGAVIITMSVAILYCAAATAANDLIFGWYYNSKTKVKEANETTALVVAQHQSGAQFWEAFRRDWFGFGGIMQHVHAMYIEGGHGHTHIFYAIPFEI